MDPMDTYMHKSNLPFSVPFFRPEKRTCDFSFFLRTWQAYVEGINWYAKKGRLPLEFKLTQQTWEPWTIVPRTWIFTRLRCGVFYLVGKKNGANFGKCIKDDWNAFWGWSWVGWVYFLGFLNMYTYVFTHDIYTLHRCMCLLMYESRCLAGRVGWYPFDWHFDAHYWKLDD